MRNPKTPAEWQEAVDLASGWRIIADAEMYGLLTGVPKINLTRCDRILALGKKAGVRPSKPAAALALDIIRASRNANAYEIPEEFRRAKE